MALNLAQVLREHHPDQWDTKQLNRLLSNRATLDTILGDSSLQQPTDALKQPLTMALPISSVAAKSICSTETI